MTARCLCASVVGGRRAAQLLCGGFVLVHVFVRRCFRDSARAAEDTGLLVRGAEGLFYHLFQNRLTAVRAGGITVQRQETRVCESNEQVSQQHLMSDFL